MSSEKKGLVKNIASVGAIQIANYVFPLITVPIVSRIIGPDKFGVLSFANAFVAYFTLFIGFGFDLTATRKVARDPFNSECRNKVFSEVLFSQILLFIVSLLVFSLCLFFLPQLKNDKLVAIFTFATCVGTVITQNWLFQAMQELHKVAILNLIAKILFTVLILIFIHQKSDYVLQPLALSISTIIIGCISFIWAINRYKLKLQPVTIHSCLKLLNEEKTYFFSMIIIGLYTTTNVVILGLLRNEFEVGYYTAGQRLITVFQSLVSIVLSQAFFPYISKAFGEDYKKGIDTSQKLLPIVLLVISIASLFLYIVGPEFLILFYGNAFKPSVTTFKILALTPIIIAFSTVVGVHVMLNLKMDKLFFKTTCIGAAFSILSNVLLVRYYGPIGSASTLVFTEFIVAIFFYMGLKQKGIEVINTKYFMPRNIFKVLFSFKK